MISIGLILASLGVIAYSYIGAFVTLAGEIERDLYGQTPISAIAKILGYINSGEIPQLTGFLYFGLFLFVAAVVNLIGGGGKRTDDDGHSL